MNEKQFGAFVKQTRQSAFPQISGFADAMHFSKSYVSDIENGRRMPSVAFLITFLSLFNLDKHAVFALTGRIPAGSTPVTYEQALEASLCFHDALGETP